MRETLTVSKLMWFTSTQAAWMAAAAEAEGVSISQIVRDAVEKYLAEVQPEPAPEPDKSKPAA